MKKKWFYISSIVVASLLIVLGVVFLFVINYNHNKPEAVTIFTSNNKTYVSSVLNDNTYGYIFKFKDEEKEVEIESVRNVVCIDNLLEEEKISLGKEYKVSVKYKNEYENGYSVYSDEVTYLASKFLASPVISADDERLTWESVENADYYEVSYSTGNGNISITTMNLYLNYDKLVGGEHNFYVVAKSGKAYFLDSPMSNVVTKTTYHTVSSFNSAVFNSETKILRIVGIENFDVIEVWIGSNLLDLIEYDFTYGEQKYFNKTILNDRYIFEIDLKLIYTDSVSIIKTRPSVSGFNIYNGEFTDVEII